MIILISGPQGSGKTTLGKRLSIDLCLSGPTWSVKFADPLYRLHDLVRVQMKHFDPDNLLGLDYAKKDGELLQLLGTEWGRAKNKNIWALLAVAKAKSLEKMAIDKRQGKNFYVIFDDLRFENEFDLIKDCFVETLTIRLDAHQDVRKQRAEYWRENIQHPSETALNLYAVQNKFDLYFDTSFQSAEEISSAVLNRIQNIKRERELIP